MTNPTARRLILVLAAITASTCSRQNLEITHDFAARPDPDPRSYLVPENALTHLHPDIRSTDLQPECGHTVKTTQRPEIFLNRVGRVTSFPEYHDCQALIAPTNTSRYAQLAALYATQDLRPTQPDSTRAYLLGYVINYGAYDKGDTDHVYRPLGLVRGVSCIYAELHKSPARAWLVPINGIDCIDLDRDVASFAASNALQVRKLIEPGATLHDYPMVARWDWDERHQEQYIGVQCGAAWCEIGRTGFASSSLPEVPPGAPEPTSFVYRIKGWFDAQRLAVYASDGRLVPGAEIGYVFPHPRLDSRDLTDFEQGLDGAIFAISRDNNVYNKKFLMKRGKNVMIGVRKGVGPNANWSARAKRDSNEKALNVVFRENTFTEIGRLRGTARWRWSDDDEKAWMSCIQGCCEIVP